MTRPFLVNSYGGCGSKFLTKQLAEYMKTDTYGHYHKHIRNPNEQLAVEYGKLIFLYGDPIQAVLSFFARRTEITALHGYDNQTKSGSRAWPKIHCKNLEGDWKSFSADWTLAEYLEQERDYFQLENFVENWLECNIDKDILFIRYETMWNHVDDIHLFMGMDKSRPLIFSAKKDRKDHSAWATEQEIKQLGSFYSSLVNKLNALPDFWVKRA